MRLSRFFLPVLKETPSEAQIVSHRYMLRAGMIRQEAAGIYAWLPLGFRVLKKIEQIVHEEMARAGAIPMLMPTLQLADLWRESGRYDAYGPEMLRITDRHDRELLYGPTNEEMITEIFRSYVRSYKDLPKNLYHIQWKFRDEQRPRFGVMRGREFLMKDAYSFDVDEAAARHSYNQMFVAYLRTFGRMGLKAIPMRAETGPIGGDLSHEFIVLAETGEFAVFCDRRVLNLPIPDESVDYGSDLSAIIDEWTNLYAATEDVHEVERYERETIADDRLETRGIEVGQVFYFGDKYSKPMKAMIAGPDGVERPAQMGSYGVGVSRLLGAIIEASHDDNGIIWPDAVAPFGVGIINLKPGDAAVDAACAKAHDALEAAGKEPLLDDTDDRAGAKFATMDLIGLPWQLVIGPKGLASGEVELKRRATGERQTLPLEAALKALGSMTDVRAAGPFSGWERAVAGRYLRAKRKEGGVALISLISFIGITLAVAVLIIVMSVMNGFRTELMGRILGFNGHVYVGGPVLDNPQDRDAAIARIRKIPGVAQVTPMVEAQGLAQGPNGVIAGSIIRGVSPSDVRRIKLIQDNFKEGSLYGFGQGEYGGNRVLLGDRLAANLGVQIGDTISLLSVTGQSTIMGTHPLQKSFVVGGIFSVGMSQYDEVFVYMPLTQAQLFFNRDQSVDVIEIMLTDPDKIDQIKPQIVTAAGPNGLVSDWRAKNHSFFSALQVERNTMFLILLMLVFIAAANIISGLVMLVKNKGRDIAILRTMGASSGAILRIFFMAGASVGVLGTIAGLLLGTLFCAYIAQIQHFVEWVTGASVFNADVYFLAHIPAKLDWNEVGLIAFAAIVMSFLATLPPAWRASRLDPVEALRYE